MRSGLVCGAKKKHGAGLCQARPMLNGRCKVHGGMSPTGPALPQFRTGRYSTSLPTRLAARYQQALTDSELLTMSDEIALLDTRLDEVVRAGVGAGAGANTEASAEAWAEIVALVEQRRRLVESERRRLLELGQMVSAGEAVVLAMQLVDVVRRHVTDRSVVAAIGREFDRLLTRPDRPRLAPPGT